jgi:hypothetical protein
MKHHWPFILSAGAVLMVGAVIGGQLLWQQYWQVRYRDIPPGTAVFSVEPAAARAGDVIELVAEFRDAYDEGFPTANQHVRVIDEGGVNVLLKGGEVTPNAGFRFPGAEGVGCAMVIAAPSEPPKQSFVSRQAIEVLAETPAGHYVIEIEPGAYCNGLPETTVRLPFQITAPTS